MVLCYLTSPNPKVDIYRPDTLKAKKRFAMLPDFHKAFRIRLKSDLSHSMGLYYSRKIKNIRFTSISHHNSLKNPETSSYLHIYHIFNSKIVSFHSNRAN